MVEMGLAGWAESAAAVTLRSGLIVGMGRGPSGAGDCYTGLHQRQDRNPDGDIMNQATGGKPAHTDEGRSRAYGQKMRSTTRMRAMGPTSDDDPGGRDDARRDAGADGLTFRQDGVEHIVRITVRRLAE